MQDLQDKPFFLITLSAYYIIMSTMTAYHLLLFSMENTHGQRDILSAVS